MNRLDRDLYAIELDGDGNKRIHIYGYAYWTGDASDAPYRLVEFAFNYIPVGLSTDAFEDIYELHLCECKQYIGDYDQAAIVKLLDEYFDEPPAELAYDDITLDTPCGYYIQS